MKYLDKFHPDNFYHIFNHAVGKENLLKNHDNYIFPFPGSITIYRR